MLITDTDHGTRQVAAAVEKEDAAFPDYLKASTIVLSVKLQDASSSLGTITE